MLKLDEVRIMQQREISEALLRKVVIAEVDLTHERIVLSIQDAFDDSLCPNISEFVLVDIHFSVAEINFGKRRVILDDRPDLVSVVLPF
jgi:hypothetical protein